mmetsp:Transcript_310/g.308  ORF Transcript_310/g.308 Transcript_310/m.308 type:complete len:323 (-) Transcript_310:90-1058(-)
MNFISSQENLLETYNSPCNSHGKILSLNYKNDDSTYFQDEGRFSYHEDTQYLSSSIDESSFRGDFNELPMFSFPPSNKFPLNQEKKEKLLSKDFSVEKTNGEFIEFKSFNHDAYSEAASYFIAENVTSPASTEVQSVSATAEKDEKNADTDIEELLNGLVSVPHYKDHRFSTRRDVINKTVFRIMKRFFKSMLPKMKLKVNTVEEYLQASETLMSSIDEFAPLKDHLKYFITQMVSTKLASKFSVSAELKESLKLLDTCLYSYSDKALRRIFTDSFSKTLFNYFYRNGQKFYKEQKCVQKNESEYMTMLENLYKSFNNSPSM